MPTLQVPKPPDPLTPTPLPWIAAVTPVILALAMSVIFQQVLALIMGLLGPAMVLGSWYESRRQASRAQQRELDQYSVAKAQYAQEVSDIRSHEKARALALVLSPEELARRWHEVADRGDIILDGVSPSDIRGATLGSIHLPPLPVPEPVLLVWRKDKFQMTSRAWWKA